MQLIARPQDSLNTKFVVVAKHNDEEIIWNTGIFQRKAFLEYDVFDHINRYWATLKEREQDYIFNCYLDIRRVFDNVWDKHQMTMDLYKLVAKLLDKHDFNNVTYWTQVHSGVYFPTNMEKVYVNTDDKPKTREQTYLQDDYIKLTVMTLILRTMVPIWGEFINITKPTNTSAFREYSAYQLIAQSQLAVSEPAQKLTTYIEFSIPSDKSRSSAIVGGVSSEDFPIWLLGMLVVSRLCVGDIRGEDQKANLITLIYSYLTWKIRGSDNSFDGIIRDKIFDEYEGEANISKLEGYSRMKQELPVGDLVAIEYVFSDLEKIAAKLAPGMPLSLLHDAIKTSKPLANTMILDPQFILIQWIMKPIISPRAIGFLSKQTLIGAAALTQAVLWYRGHYALAGLVTAITKDNSQNISMSGGDSRERIPKELLEEISKLYPFAKRVGGKLKNLNKPTNQAIADIDSMNELLSQRCWFLTINDNILKIATEGVSTRRFTLPKNTKVLLAKLVIEIAKRNWKK